MRTPTRAALLTLAAAFVGLTVTAASAQTVDRGLPAANLNNAAGADRSNVAWSQGNDWITGDTVTIGSPGETWVVTAVRTWNIGHLGLAFGDEFSDDALYFGAGAVAPIASGTVLPGSSIDSNPTIGHSLVTYQGVEYQAQDNSYRQIWQNDFTNLHIVVNGGQIYYFAVDGTASDYYWFNHASNAALSGSAQDGADNVYVTWAKGDLSAPTNCDSAGSANDCDGGWDKSSDINVQVFAMPARDACKDGGWESLTRADESEFKNQGDCIQYFNTGK